MGQPATAAPGKRVPLGPVRQDETPATSGETVTIAYKGAGDLLLRLHRFHDVRIEAPTGSYTVKQARPVPGASLLIRGPSYAQGEMPRAPIYGGYAITRNVPKDFWDAWCEQNSDSDLLANKMMFALPTIDAVKSEARNNRTLRSGLEPMEPDPQNDPRAPKHIRRDAATDTDIELE